MLRAIVHCVIVVLKLLDGRDVVFLLATCTIAHIDCRWRHLHVNWGEP